ncbi:MAG TPA: urate hydroxylase PuuD, partial [Burkholderiales bacterium]|nr:urate hydroxylase PuuD [Burkholderiales bacterium]
MDDQTLLDWLVVGLRWAHIVAILGWVGASLYFNWLESKLRVPDPKRENVLGEAWMGHGGGFYIVEKRQIAAGQVPSPVYWFRVEAGVTWLTGFLLLVFVYYWTGGVDLLAPGTSVLGPQAAIAFAVGLML